MPGSVRFFVHGFDGNVSEVAVNGYNNTYPNSYIEITVLNSIRVNTFLSIWVTDQAGVQSSRQDVQIK